jgi:hypothetical protein
LRSDGNFSSTLKLPQAIEPGSHQIIAIVGNQSASAVFTVVSADQKFSPRIRFVDARGQKPVLMQGNTYTLQGEGFVSGLVQITFDSDPKILAKATVNNTGAFQVPVPLPAAVTSGTHVFHAREQAGGKLLEAVLSEVIAITPR